jgi:thioredoxin reductase
MTDVVIVGGSVAGLSAALLLARCRREVIVCDEGLPRNRFSHQMHGFLSREGIPPSEFLQISRDQIAEFPNVRFHRDRIISIRGEGDGFEAETKDGIVFRCSIILLATGIVDELPDLPGIETLYGRTVHHCPYCDGWEHRDESLAVYGKGEAALELAKEMLTWSTDVVYFSDGLILSESARAKLAALGVGLVEKKIASLVGNGGKLEMVKLADGENYPRQAMFFVSSQRQNCDLARQLGCELKDEFVTCDNEAKTCVPGLYVAGNTSTGLQLAIVAAAEGAKAAHSINTELNERATAR